MIKLQINGRTVSGAAIADELTKALMEGATKLVDDELCARIRSIRHPESGEFPTVTVRGEGLGDRRYHVEGSPQLLGLVRERMSLIDLEQIELQPPVDGAPRAFLSYAGP